MPFELIIVLLAALVVSIPIIAWSLLRRLSASERMASQTEELHGLENNLSLMIKELQLSVDKGLYDMEEAADRLKQVIEKADDRIRQLEYYYEFGEELRPLPIPEAELVRETTKNPSPQRQTMKHKEVHELAQKGWSASQIAKHTSMSADEVQLIVNLMEISTIGIKPDDGLPRQPMI